MNEFLQWETFGTFAGVGLGVGIFTQLLKGAKWLERISPQLVSYALALLFMVGSQLALGEFTWSRFALNFINAGAVSLAANGGYDGVNAILKFFNKKGEDFDYEQSEEEKENNV